MKTLKVTQSTMGKRVSRFLDLEPLPIQIDKTIPQAGKDIVYARKLLSVIGLDPSEGKTPINSGAPIIGAGGIGFDVAEYLTHKGESTALNVSSFLKEWGIDHQLNSRGGIEGVEPLVVESPREVFLMQRKESKIGAGLGKTTGWVHRISLKNKNTKMINAVQYDRIDDQGLHYTRRGVQHVLAVDNVIVCAGQLSNNEMLKPLEEMGKQVHLIGGADLALELDAKHAINQGSRLAAEI